MKISMMTNEQAADALIRLSVPFGNICEDAETMRMIEQFQQVGETPIIQTIGKMLPQIVAHLLKTHKKDLFEIVGALAGKTVAQVAKMNFMETIRIVRDSWDSDLKDFFTSLNKPTTEAEEQS